MNNSHDANASRQDRLNLIIAEYLDALQSGRVLDRQELIDNNRDLADELRAFLKGHDTISELRNQTFLQHWKNT